MKRKDSHPGGAKQECCCPAGAANGTERRPQGRLSGSVRLYFGTQVSLLKRCAPWRRKAQPPPGSPSSPKRPAIFVHPKRSLLPGTTTRAAYV